MADQYIEDILGISTPQAPFPNLAPPQQNAVADSTIEDILGVSQPKQPTSFGETLMDAGKSLGWPAINAVLGGVLGPKMRLLGAAKSGIPGKVMDNISIPGAVLGALNPEQPLNATNTGNLIDTLTHTKSPKLKAVTKLSEKFLPTEAKKQALSAAAPGGLMVAQSNSLDEAGDNAILAALGIAGQAGLGKTADITRMDERGYRGAAVKVNNATRQLKDVMSSNPNNKTGKQALEATDKLRSMLSNDPNYSKVAQQAAVFKQHPEVFADIEQLRASLPVAKQREIAQNPIKQVASKQIDSLLTGNHIKKGFSKSIPLAKLRTYREAVPDSTELTQAYAERVHKELDLPGIVKGSADPGKVRRVIDSVKLDPEAKQIIFGDRKRGDMFEEVLEELYGASKQSSATLNLADHIGSTMGASGVRVGIMGALVDLNSWANLLGKKDYLKQQQGAIKTLKLINNPSRIKELETQTGRRGLKSALVRSLVTTLYDSSGDEVTEEPFKPESKISIVPPETNVVRQKQ